MLGRKYNQLDFAKAKVLVEEFEKRSGTEWRIRERKHTYVCQRHCVYYGVSRLLNDPTQIYSSDINHFFTDITGNKYDRRTIGHGIKNFKVMLSHPKPHPVFSRAALDMAESLKIAKSIDLHSPSIQDTFEAEMNELVARYSGVIPKKTMKMSLNKALDGN